MSIARRYNLLGLLCAGAVAAVLGIANAPAAPNQQVGSKPDKLREETVTLHDARVAVMKADLRTSLMGPKMGQSSFALCVATRLCQATASRYQRMWSWLDGAFRK
jgi:hypothetical protein